METHKNPDALRPAPGTDPETGLPSLASLGRRAGTLAVAGILAELSSDARGVSDSIPVLAGLDEDGAEIWADLVVSYQEEDSVAVELYRGHPEECENDWGGGWCVGCLAYFRKRKGDPARGLLDAAEFVWELAVREVS